MRRNNNTATTIDREEANYDYFIGLAGVEKERRREKFARKQADRETARVRKQMKRDTRRFRDAVDADYGEY